MQMYDKYLRTKALSVVYSCISMLGVMSGVYKVPFGNFTCNCLSRLFASELIFFPTRKKPVRW